MNSAYRRVGKNKTAGQQVLCFAGVLQRPRKEKTAY